MKQSFKKIFVLISTAAILIVFQACSGFKSYQANDLASEFSAKGRMINEVELYHRCYGHITQNRVPIEDARLKKVRAGSLSAVQACMQVLNSALLTGEGNTRIADPANVEQKQVVRTFQNLHLSWLNYREVYFIGDGWGVMGNHYDTGGATAAYFTRALLHPSLNVESILTEKQELIPVRTVMSPTTGAYGGAGSYIPGLNIMAPVGDILGAKTIADRTLASNIGTMNLSRNYGAGFITSSSYLATSSDVGGIDANGAAIMPRVWARSVLRDALCRELPVVRTSDAVPFVVVEASAIAFRRYASCTACHASMDRMASTLRNLRSTTFTPSAASVGDLFHYTMNPVNQPEESGWPTSNDDNYSRRPPKGVFYFRTHDGRLINTPVANAEELAGQILATDDFYNCVASRYYQYFLGVKTNIGDISDPSSPVHLSAQDLYHRKQVIALGQALHTHKNVRQLLEQILSLPDYRKSNFGTN